MYKVIETKTNATVNEVKKLEEAKTWAKNRKINTKNDYYIKSDGIKIWDTQEGDNKNIFFL